MKVKKAELTLEYLNYIPEAPVQAAQLYKTACGNDEATINAWREIWVKNVRVNKERFGSFAERGIGKFFGSLKYKPAIIAGAGPSLVRNGHELKDRGDIALISCLHNFHYFEDQGVKVDFYVSLDAGDITIGEVSEGGAKSEEEYWEATKDKVLLAYIGSPPKLLEKWRGEIYFFNCPLPDRSVEMEVDAIERFASYVSSGGNVLGACLYIAKAIMGANPIAFVGADFSFSYDKKFHGWNSKYDVTMGQVQRTVDVFGNKVFTWPSYHGFKCFFDYIAQTVPGLYFNCTEGGTFGAYPEGNIMAVRQMDLCDFLQMYHLSDEVRENFVNPAAAPKKILY